MVVTGQHGDACPRLPIPDPDSLIITGADNPRVFMVKLDSSDVVQMPNKGEQASMRFVVPHLDLVVIT